jgi:hypothetical protein
MPIMKILSGKLQLKRLEECCKLKAGAVCFVFVGLVLFAMGCGKKGPPVPPAHVPPPVVKNLDVRLEESIAVLTWPVPDSVSKGTEPDTENAVAGFYVYYIKTAVEGEYRCPNCPVQFERMADVPAPVAGTSMAFEMPLEKGFHHAFAVSCYTETGEEGNRSDAVTLTY